MTRLLAPKHTRLVAVFIAAALALYLHETEGGLAALHAGAVTGAIFAALALVTGRALVSMLATAALVALIAAIAWIKRARTDFILHAWDLFDPGQWRFLDAEALRAQPLASAIALAAALGLAALLVFGRRAPADLPRRVAAGLFLVCALGGGVAAHLKGEPKQTQYTWSDLHLSSFYSSWPEAMEALWRGHILDVGPRIAAVRFDPARACAPGPGAPHIILIHQESVTPPGALPGVAYDPALDAFFRSHDGRTHTLRVETYGGGSWLSEFSILTGMSSRFFGGLRNFVQIYMAGRVGDALPATLARCGYRNVMFYPYRKGFFGSARFFESVGLRDIRDSDAQKAPTAQESDSFYYANALAEIERHRAASAQPLFIFLQTMTAHWPYDVTYWPERDTPGGGSDPEMHEYLRRLGMAKIDYDALRRDLAARFPTERFLIVHYGDHHPLTTRRLFGFDAEEIEAINRALPPDSKAFETYFASEGVNYAPPPLPTAPAVDAAYLGAVLLQQAGLPAPDSWRARLDLMNACAGRYATCADRGAVLAFHRRLVESGLVRAR